MEATYHRELNATWMILGGENECEEFALRILQENRLEGLMPFSVRRIDGRTEYWFEISRGKSLARILEKRPVTVREIRGILFAIDQVIRRMEEYLLDPDHLILEPELIYAAPDAAHLLFCCHPAVKRNFFDQIRDLVQYFLNKSDHLAEHGVETVYALFRVCQQEYFRFDDLLAVFGPEEPERKRPEEGSGGEEKREEDLREVQAEQPDGEKEFPRIPVLPILTGAAGLLLLLFSVLRLMKGGGFGVKGIFGGGLLLLLAVVLVFLERKNDEKEEVVETTGLRSGEPSPVSAGPAGMEASVYAKKAGRQAVPREAATELLSENLRMPAREKVLISENSLQYETIRMNKMPFVIGKLTGAADFILKRATVSRIHARLEQQGDDFFLTDCNSTNGTYINGVRLAPNQRYPLREGDEVVFADLKYIFQ